MNKNVKAVFEMLGVEPNEEFGVRFSDNSTSCFKHRITEKLNTEWFDAEINYWEKDSDCEYLKNLLTGEFKIIKQPKFTEIEQKAIELYKLLGAKYIAKDDSGLTWAYRDRPHKEKSVNLWAGNSMLDYHISVKNKLEFDFLNWSDEEPYYIGD